MKTTIKTIAQKCNVSPVTVSRVIANNPSVNEKTRQFILDTMKELDYRPQKVEALTERQRARMIVMVMEDITRNANAIVRAAANYLRENGYLSIFCETGAKAAYFDEYLTALIERGVVDGCIVITSLAARTELARIAEKHRQLPLVAVHWCEAWSKVDSVILDSYHGSICGVNFLADMGHRYIALVNAPPEASGSYEERMGYLDTMHRRGLPADEKYILSGNLEKSGGVQAARKLLSEMPEVTAVLSSNYAMARGIVDELAAAGKRVPEDISVVPFGIFQSGEDQRDFTAVGASYVDAGIIAARIVLERIQEIKEHQIQFNTVKKVVLEPEVFLGTSAQPPAKAYVPQLERKR
ncbi:MULTISPECIES: LacI family DNA-binding transcriptional regulator [unclassified Anaerotruncus]|jgi:DNA-binding LacI/PurR family transcriptional regulator|uniref:LacI family DNA-binding transcriptional regulator n=1 Tax=unclassified Anaerotruncus TaxID=2641626 RepID=UPI00034151D2|nr:MULTISPECIES: LacI family DNA-binding transcriptional regulator [unclassified Anaerotruncus]MCI9159486.1 LacI family transcriptional regulator [Anaerotruncus sp.]NCE74063.1 LacI family transcriptional regulator [Anaerotruncus sp. X29]RKJ81619.1 LacI family transcriptional regulator [Anaerotruncus sp. 1XD22-93]EOS62911.1 hypothetical protein C814_01059 [Anaerotruncus sp. G3(2012)]MCI9234981.1 LacI family transcriptional regulator [Anaerotruncus sp.]